MTTNREIRERNIPHPSVWKTLCKRLRVKPNSLQLLQALTHDDKTHHLQLCTKMQQHLEKDSHATKFILRDKAMFHLHGKVNGHSACILGSKNPHAAIEHNWDSPKLNIYCAISNKAYRPFFFAESTVTSMSYLEVMKE
jgi:hypothetical protein